MATDGVEGGVVGEGGKGAARRVRIVTRAHTAAPTQEQHICVGNVHEQTFLKSSAMST